MTVAAESMEGLGQHLEATASEGTNSQTTDTGSGEQADKGKPKFICKTDGCGHVLPFKFAVCEKCKICNECGDEHATKYPDGFARVCDCCKKANNDPVLNADGTPQVFKDTGKPRFASVRLGYCKTVDGKVVAKALCFVCGTRLRNAGFPLRIRGLLCAINTAKKENEAAEQRRKERQEAKAAATQRRQARQELGHKQCADEAQGMAEYAKLFGLNFDTTSAGPDVRPQIRKKGPGDLYVVGHLEDERRRPRQ